MISSGSDKLHTEKVGITCNSTGMYTYEDQVLDQIGYTPVGDNEDSSQRSGHADAVTVLLGVHVRPYFLGFSAFELRAVGHLVFVLVRTAAGYQLFREANTQKIVDHSGSHSVVRNNVLSYVAFKDNNIMFFFFFFLVLFLRYDFARGVIQSIINVVAEGAPTHVLVLSVSREGATNTIILFTSSDAVGQCYLRVRSSGFLNNIFFQI